MSNEDSVFLCNACHEKLRGKTTAYRHIREGYGLQITDSDPRVEIFLEQKFLREINRL